MPRINDHTAWRATWEDSVKRTSLDRNLAKQNPARVFESPFEIVSETLFTKGEKLGTLNRWRQAILEDEAMRTYVTPERARVLGQIEEAKRHLFNANPP
jgi:hypothetical protein